MNNKVRLKNSKALLARILNLVTGFRLRVSSTHFSPPTVVLDTKRNIATTYTDRFNKRIYKLENLGNVISSWRPNLQRCVSESSSTGSQ
jgi:hypothetical protein